MKRSIVGLMATLVVLGCSPQRRTFTTHVSGALTWQDNAGAPQKLAGEQKLNVDIGDRFILVTAELSDGQKCSFNADESSKGTYVFVTKERVCSFTTAGGPVTFKFDTGTIVVKDEKVTFHLSGTNATGNVKGTFKYDTSE